MIPPPVCWPRAGRWLGVAMEADMPATYFAVSEITQGVG